MQILGALLNQIDRFAQLFRRQFILAELRNAFLLQIGSVLNDEIILHRHIETGKARIALTARTAAQLVVDPLGFMPFRT